ncbi:MAG: type II secretion system GspH family protein [Desulfobacterales bacterium]|nr:type II secretion system GspH family protein [Desulfobacterales bacterium]
MPVTEDRRQKTEDRGFTLIELVMTIVILGFSSLIIVPFFQAITSSPDPMIRQRSIALGQAMMDEILAKRWDENTPIGGGPVCTATESGTGRGNATYTLDCATETTRIASAIGLDIADGDAAADRTTWDDVDDYNYLNFAGGNYEDGTFTDQAGATVSFPGFKRWVEIDYIASSTAVTDITRTTPASSGQGSADSTDSKRIVVQVQSPTGQVYTFVAVSCNF